MTNGVIRNYSRYVVYLTRREAFRHLFDRHVRITVQYSRLVPPEADIPCSVKAYFTTDEVEVSPDQATITPDRRRLLRTVIRGVPFMITSSEASLRVTIPLGVTSTSLEVYGEGGGSASKTSGGYPDTSGFAPIPGSFDKDSWSDY
jgi:hypothetical protein